jgi:phosphosulfolactate phosphohydrolase-like enzyme
MEYFIMKDKVSIYDHLTGETIVREMTDEEQAQRDSEVAAYLARKEAEAQAAIEAQAKRQALLDKLGITEDEARLLLGGN